MTTIRTLAAALGAALLLTTATQAADLLVGPADNIYDSQMFNFEGFYLGATLGLGNFPVTGRAGTVGVVAGTNVALSEAFIAGAEFQADAVWNDTGFTGVNALILGKLGGYLAEETLLYGTAGGGTVDGKTAYALGIGLEQALTDQISIRGEAMGTGAFNGSFDGGKAAVGVLWHMN